MPDPAQDVNTSDSSTEEQVVEQEGVTTTPEVVEEGQTQETSTQEVKPEVVKQPDSRPEINYAMEAARKANEALEIARQLQQQQQQPVQQQPQYSKGQLRAFAEQTQEPAQKVWALEEIDKLDKSERQKEMRELFESHTKRTEGEVKRQQSTNFVAQNFPQCFVKDTQGNVLGWDNNNPLTQKIGQYMQDPRLANEPEGIVIASKAAAFDLGISARMQQKLNLTNAQLKREQKKTLIAGGGTQIQAGGTDSKAKQIAKLVAEYQKTGDRKVFTELARLRGLTAPVTQ